jgi:ribonuclease HI
MSETDLVLAYADGGSRGNPGPAGIGALLKQDGITVAEISEALGVATNNVAEYTALIRIMEKALELGFKKIAVHMDSELAVKQMVGAYKVKNEGLQPLFNKAQQLSRKFDSFSIVHVRREMNKEADKLANAAMDKAAVTT